MQVLANGSTGNSTFEPSGSVSVRDARSTATVGAFRQSEQFRVHIGRHRDRKQGILERVIFENIRKRSADYSPETELRQCPRSVFARTAAAEVIAGQQNFRAFRPRRIQDEVRLRIALGVISPVIEELLIQPFLRGRFQEPRRNDLIGIDIVDDRTSGKRRKLSKQRFYNAFTEASSHRSQHP